MDRFESIVVDVDATAAVHHELERAISLARRCGAKLTIVDSTTASARASRALPADVAEDVVEARRRALIHLARGVSALATTSRLLVGQAATVLVQEVLQSKHDLLVRSHARDLTATGSTCSGSVDQELLRKCPCPVLLVGPGRTPERPRIAGVVGSFTDDPAEDAVRAKVLKLTLLMARLEQGVPMLLHTWVPFAEEMIRANALEDGFAAYVEGIRDRTAADFASLTQSLDRHWSDVRTLSRRGQAEAIVPEFTVHQGIDLVVMAAPTNDGIAGRLFARRRETFLQKLTCSLLAVKPDDFVPPGRRAHD